MDKQSNEDRSLGVKANLRIGDDGLFKKPGLKSVGYILFSRRIVRVYNGFNTIGKSSASNITIYDTTPSEEHAVIYARGSKWFIKHLCPSNSTIMQEKADSEPKKLRENKWYKMPKYARLVFAKVMVITVTYDIAEALFPSIMKPRKISKGRKKVINSQQLKKSKQRLEIKFSKIDRIHYEVMEENSQ